MDNEGMHAPKDLTIEQRRGIELRTHIGNYRYIMDALTNLDTDDPAKIISGINALVNVQEVITREPMSLEKKTNYVGKLLETVISARSQAAAENNDSGTPVPALSQNEITEINRLAQEQGVLPPIVPSNQSSV